MLRLFHSALVYFIRLPQIKHNQLAVRSILLPRHAVSQLLAPAAGLVHKSDKPLALNVVVLPRYLIWQPVSAAVIYTAGLYPQKQLLRAKAEPEELRIAHGHQSLFEYSDPAGFDVERYAR